MSVTERQIEIIKFLQSTLQRVPNQNHSKQGFLTLEKAREYCKRTNSIVSHHYHLGDKSYLWFSDDHLYGYKDVNNKLRECVPSTSYLPYAVVARPGLESGIVSNLDDWMVVHYHPERSDVLIDDFNEFIRFIDEQNLYTGE